MRFSERAVQRLASGLRLVSSAALLVLVTAIFYQPLRIVLGPRASPAVSRLPLPSFLAGGPAAGFLLQISSTPPGATVWVEGVVRGRTPAILNVLCKEGQVVALAVRKPGFPEYRRNVPCRQGQTATARIDLGKAGG